jgi:shikimate dehydrogenase
VNIPDQGKQERLAAGDFMIDASTEVYGVFGNPIAHSMGPVMHNAAFEDRGLNAVYLAFRIEDIGKGVQAIRELGIRGVSVTLPFKESVIPFLDEIGDQARFMGCVNTIVNRNGRLCGYNTDQRGAVEPLLEYTSLKNRRVLLIGAGGAAKAVAFGLKNESALISIVNRSEFKGRALADQVGARFIPMGDIPGLNPEIIINATSLGMTPRVDVTPFPADLLTPGMIVMDIVYNPLHTRFLREAETSGCRVIDGLSMFVNQGAAQFELFTGTEAPVRVMRDAVLKAMRKR